MKDIRTIQHQLLGIAIDFSVNQDYQNVLGYNLMYDYFENSYILILHIKYTYLIV